MKYYIKATEDFLRKLKTRWNTAMKLNNSENSCADNRLLRADLTSQLEDYIRSSEPLLPQSKIPNVREFKVKVTPNYHPIFKEHKDRPIFKRQYPPRLESIPYKNKSMNRYIMHQFLRLNKALSNPRLFWKISESLLRRSTCYATLMVHETFKGWHRNRSYSEVYGTLLEYLQLDLNDYRYKEKGIPKSNGEIRWLGVPSLPWRLYLHSLQVILQVWLSPYNHPSQHAYIKGRGCVTAWRQIHEEVLSSPNIYEFDFRKFFDSINLDYLDQILKGLQIPCTLRGHLIRWSRTSAYNSPMSRNTWTSEEQEICDYKYHKTGVYPIATRTEHLYWLREKRGAESKNPRLTRYDYFHGVPQGGSISPLLSNLVITWLLLLNPGTCVVQYADDGLLYNYTGDPTRFLRFPAESGIEYHPLKSHIIRQDGLWIRSLKFLGLLYNPFDRTHTTSQGGSLSTSTRDPKEYTFEDYKLIEAACRYDGVWDTLLEPALPGVDTRSCDYWFRSSYHGYVMSRLYQGSLHLENVQQDFTYTHSPSSWSCAEVARRISNGLHGLLYRLNGDEITPDVQIDTFNSSSFACYSLNNRLRNHLTPPGLLSPLKATNGFTS